MPTLADREDWDEGFASRLASWMARREECGGWDEDDDWLDDWELGGEAGRDVAGVRGARPTQRRLGAAVRRPWGAGGECGCARCRVSLFIVNSSRELREPPRGGAATTNCSNCGSPAPGSDDINNRGFGLHRFALVRRGGYEYKLFPLLTPEYPPAPCITYSLTRSSHHQLPHPLLSSPTPSIPPPPSLSYQLHPQYLHRLHCNRIARFVTGHI